MWAVAVSRRGQLVLPKEVRQRVGLLEGGHVAVEVEADRRIVLEVPRPSSLRPESFLQWEGCLHGTTVVDDLMQEHVAELRRGR